jgi:hypothetical protein
MEPISKKIKKEPEYEKKNPCHVAITTTKWSMVSVVNILFVSAILADTNHRIQKIATFKYRLFPIRKTNF